MFGSPKQQNNTPETATPQSTPPAASYTPSTTSETSANFVSKDVSINGKLKLSGDITIDGKLDGEINSKGVVTISNNADIKANIFAKTIIVSGKVVGNLSAVERLEILQTAQISGDVKAAILKVEPGANIAGGCQVGASVKVTEPASSAPAKSVPAASASSKPKAAESAKA